jgi:hypothetical protein
MLTVAIAALAAAGGSHAPPPPPAPPVPPQPPDQPAPAPAGDTSAPQTEFVAGPRRTIRTRRERARVRFRFRSEAGAHFVCRVDGGAEKACKSPLVLRLRRGRHTVRIGAIDAAGNADPTPVVRRFRIRAKE